MIIEFFKIDKYRGENALGLSSDKTQQKKI